MQTKEQRSIFRIAREERDFFRSQNIVLVPSDSDDSTADVLFNQYNTIKQSHRLSLSKYKTGDGGAGYDYKYFFNIIEPRKEHATKNLDLDTKDLQAVTEEGTNRIRTYILQKRLNRWMKYNGIAKLLNDIADELPGMGTVVLKKVKDKLVDIVDLRYFVNDQSAKSLDDSSFILEEHQLNISDLKEKALNDEWNFEATLRAIEYYRTSQRDSYQEAQAEEKYTFIDPFVKVWEIYAQVPRSVLNDALLLMGKNPQIKEDEEDDYIWAMFILAGADDFTTVKGTNGEKLTQEKGEILFAEEIEKEDIPYKEIHWNRIKGRWLGFGLYEKMGDIQAMRNENVNLLMKAMRIATLQLFQSPDNLIETNLLRDAESGDIIESSNGVSRIDTSDIGSNLASYINDQTEQLANLLANTPEVVTGESLPSGAPFRLAAQLNINANKLFEFKRENIGIPLREILNEWVVPELAKEMKQGDLMDLAEETDTELVVSSLKKYMTANSIVDFSRKARRLPSAQELDALTQFLDQEITANGVPRLEIPKGYLDLKYKLDFIITGERFNKPVMIESISNFLNLLSGNPQMLVDPTTRELLKFAMEMAGIPPELVKDPVPQLTAPPEQGQTKNRVSLPTAEQKLPSGVTTE